MLNLAASVISNTDYSNPYDGLPQIKYTGSKTPKKSHLSKKQVKSRAASKRAKKTRKRNN